MGCGIIYEINILIYFYVLSLILKDTIMRENYILGFNLYVFKVIFLLKNDIEKI